jgi:probable HAF family extracellular repeat protein
MQRHIMLVTSATMVACRQPQQPDDRAATTRAFLWSHGVMQPLWSADYANHEFDRVTALNDQGQVVGYGGAPPVVHALLWEGGTGWDLGTLGGANSEARAINARGDIGGQAETTSGEAHAVLWRRVTPQLAARAP